MLLDVLLLHKVDGIELSHTRSLIHHDVDLGTLGEFLLQCGVLVVIIIMVCPMSIYTIFIYAATTCKILFYHCCVVCQSWACVCCHGFAYSHD